MFHPSRYALVLALGLTGCAIAPPAAVHPANHLVAAGFKTKARVLPTTAVVSAGVATPAAPADPKSPAQPSASPGGGFEAAAPLRAGDGATDPGHAGPSGSEKLAPASLALPAGALKGLKIAPIFDESNQLQSLMFEPEDATIGTAIKVSAGLPLDVSQVHLALRAEAAYPGLTETPIPPRGAPSTGAPGAHGPGPDGVNSAFGASAPGGALKIGSDLPAIQPLDGPATTLALGPAALGLPGTLQPNTTVGLKLAFDGDEVRAFLALHANLARFTAALTLDGPAGPLVDAKGKPFAVTFKVVVL